MLTLLRRLFIDSWLGRILAVLIFVAFVGWGANDIFLRGDNMDADVLALVDGKDITRQDFARSLQLTMNSVFQRTGTNDINAFPPQIRQQIIQTALARLITQKEIVGAAQRYGLVVPDDFLREVVFSLSNMKNENGQFDRKIFDDFLKNRGMTEKNFLDSMRSDILAQALLTPLAAGVTIPQTLADIAFTYNTEKRVLDMVHIPYPTLKLSPSHADLERYYANHPWQFEVPEFRRIKLVMLSTDTIARVINVSEADIKKAYDADQAQFHKTAQRSFYLLSADSEQKLVSLVTSWKKGQPWAAVKEQAKRAGITVLEMNKLTADQIPSAELAKMVFSAPIHQVTGPIKTAGGWQAIEVTEGTADTHLSLAQAHDRLRNQIAKIQAASLLSDRVQQLQDILAGGNGFDQIPPEMGVAAVEGTLNSQGMTQNAEPAPIPASGPVRQAILKEAFSASKGGHPNVIRGPEDTYFALQVEDIQPAHRPPFSQVAEKVAKAWLLEQEHHQANEEATHLYISAQKQPNGVASLKGEKIHVTKSPAFTRSHQEEGLPSALAEAAFQLQPAQSTMVQTEDGFYVISLAEVTHKTPDPENADYKTLKENMRVGMQNEIQQAYVHALSSSFKPKISSAVIQDVIHTIMGPG